MSELEINTALIPASPDIEEHSPYGGSQAHRWMNCPGSIKLIAENGPYPKDEKPSAARGTALHAIAAACIRRFYRGIEKKDIKNIADEFAIETGYICNMADIEDVEAYYGFIHAIRQQGYSQIWIEHPVSISWVDKSIRGTLDLAILDSLRKTLYVFDYKTGVIPVSAYDNEQLLTYALGLVGKQNLFGIDNVVIYIVQTSLINWQENKFIISSKDLLAWGESKLAPAYAATKAENPALAPDENKQCKFCLAKTKCSSRITALLPRPVAQYTPILPDIKSLSPDQIADILDKKSQLISWLNELTAFVEGGLRQGTLQIPGYGFIETKGRNSRKWKSEAEANLSLMYGFDVFSLRSVSEVEKLLGKEGKEFIKSLVDIIPGTPGLKLTKTDQPVSVSATDDFANV